MTARMITFSFTLHKKEIATNMGRFLGTSPTSNSERGRRYEMLRRESEEEENSQQVPVNAASPNSSVTENECALTPASATTRLANVRSDEREQSLQFQHQEDMADQEKKSFEECHPTEKAECGSVSPPSNEIEEDKDTPQNDDLASVSEEGTATDPNAINVRILDLNGKFFNISCQIDWSVARLKQKVLECTEVAVTSQRLIYRGRVLEEDATLESYKVEDGHTIHLFVRAAPTPDPEILNAELSASGSTSGGREDGITVININNDIVSSAVFPSDSARRVDPLMLDSPLGNGARRVKLWSSFLLIIYTMKVMGQFALLANEQQQRAAQREQETLGASETDRSFNRYDEYPQYFTPDPLISAVELMVHCFGVYVGCVGFKAAHDTDIRPIRFFCRGVVGLAVLTVTEQIYTTVQISESDFPTERVQYAYGQGPTKDDIVSANVFQTILLMTMWLIAIRHSYQHKREVSVYNQSFAIAAMNAVPPVQLPEVV
ncbi:hypothetical protein PsorP6_004458 [Peronosclerospora sorghi]|uniref:Uncharacterized protein n=1 Tax=Peronosclerospora sorghi TaxID=230839 RepID=A0ACC0VJF0_9STRA|nr:hypothetical protein PsorP6_004458 [Peronosclerospora sorghi]